MVSLDVYLASSIDGNPKMSAHRFHTYEPVETIQTFICNGCDHQITYNVKPRGYRLIRHYPKLELLTEDTEDNPK